MLEKHLAMGCPLGRGALKIGDSQKVPIIRQASILALRRGKSGTIWEHFFTLRKTLRI